MYKIIIVAEYYYRVYSYDLKTFHIILLIKCKNKDKDEKKKRKQIYTLWYDSLFFAKGWYEYNKVIYYLIGGVASRVTGGHIENLVLKKIRFTVRVRSYINYQWNLAMIIRLLDN
jgi:hypothetical protein